MTATQGIDTKAGEEVEIPLTFGVEEIGTFAPNVEAIEADRLEDPCQLVIQMLLVQRVVLTVPGTE